ncbi:methyltransferase family protein [Nitriliruptor alkaliphilus]|uniref:methyltransferase family protein n=1 Tax=Nitriliruptor alkaliphilus TaxID=427918 RepID=UPI000697BE8F|nr:isoprenylcysteine carboxylmethyltransferase family protein [Nitriliruptor alkaliphilus]
MRSLERAAVGTVAFFLVAPSVVAGVVPWLLTGWESGRTHAGGQAIGAVLVVVGAVVLIDAFVRFVREGRGTPAPVAPTEHLVVGGLYRYVRNPMYVAVVALILGQALVLGRSVLYAYAATVWATVAVFVRTYEEPTLQRQFGGAYASYRRNVPAWRPRLRPWHPEPPEQN